MTGKYEEFLKHKPWQFCNFVVWAAFPRPEPDKLLLKNSNWFFSAWLQLPIRLSSEGDIHRIIIISIEKLDFLLFFKKRILARTGFVCLALLSKCTCDNAIAVTYVEQNQTDKLDKSWLPVYCTLYKHDSYDSMKRMQELPTVIQIPITEQWAFNQNLQLKFYPSLPVNKFIDYTQEWTIQMNKYEDII